MLLAPTWGTPLDIVYLVALGEVLIHAPTWGAMTNYKALSDEQKFQSTHPHGVRRSKRRQPLPCQGFNPRTHMGCDTTRPNGGRRRVMFQSTHPHGVRHCKPCAHLRKESFNPRTHMGCDCPFVARLALLNNVSIHAPTWGATLVSCSLLHWSQFQSTHPHGVRRNKVRPCCCLVYVSIHAPTWGATIQRMLMHL